MGRTLASLTDVDLSRLAGVGPAKEKALATFGLHNVFDLLTHYPRRYIDRTKEAQIRDLELGETASVLARVTEIQSRRVKGGRVMITGTVRDDSGTMKISFFNQAWREKQLAPGTEAVFFGKLEDFRGRRQMTNPVVDLIGDRTGKVVPVYPQSEKVRLTSWDVGRWVAESLRRAGEFDDPVPEFLLDRHDLVDRTSAFRGIHVPETWGEFVVARKRLVFDELLRVQLALVLRKRKLEATTAGIAHEASGWLVRRFLDGLPFELTDGQKTASAEITADLRQPAPMHRLLQGDVGAGKTVVAVAAMLAAVEGERQAALMAPTEVLAEQHASSVKAMLDGFSVGEEGALFDRPLRVELLTNRVPAARRRQITEDLATGLVDIVIGTHALLSADVDFAALGVVVIDEQHRFGVEQRAALRDKAGGVVPDVLVMTATPIPRTAAMTVYGDLDVSRMRQMPRGRTPIETIWPRTEEAQAAMWEQVRAEVRAGRQAYVVCPLVEESEKLEVTSATETFELLQATELEGSRVGLLHGRIKGDEKETTMDAFRRGDLDVLVATTVIEVGVDVPNATVMVILDADRFGIAQLHQLRGRVGRGEHPSTCYLVGEGNTEDGAARIEALVASTDGFDLAEVDLDLRGEGTIMGARQKGMSDLKLASLQKDRAVVEDARAAAFDLVDGPDGVPEALLDELRLFLDEEEQEFLFKS
ncbi:ATP-dependent DNA helicase RecG [Actinospongicola halichondriae]|uniref:ATP-dependent DNA helicase RecG n=1 Tax=Actinospongicola halichondriae TaxID=3236844 RepID=UPI003D3A3873